MSYVLCLKNADLKRTNASPVARPSGFFTKRTPCSSSNTEQGSSPPRKNSIWTRDKKFWNKLAVFRIRICRIHMFLSLPDPDVLVKDTVRIRILISSSKNCKKKIDSFKTSTKNNFFLHKENPRALRLTRSRAPPHHGRTRSGRGKKICIKSVFRIRIRRIHMFLGLPYPDPLVRDTDPDPYIIKQK